MYLGENIRKLGFGLMRLPQKGGAIDVEQVKVMVDKFLAAGFTYFDTAWMYHDFESERAIRKALVERIDRGRYTLTTKLHISLVGSATPLSFAICIASCHLTSWSVRSRMPRRKSYFPALTRTHCFPVSSV